MGRIKLAMVIGGGILAFIGGQEFLVSWGGGSSPLPVELADFEAGKTPERNYVEIGEHVAVYGGAVYSYSKSKYDSSEPDSSTKITECFYPIISHSHPFVEGLAKLEEEYGSMDQVPDDAPFPDLDSFSVIVKAKHFKTVGSIPDGLSVEDALEGLVINQIESLDKEEKDLIRSSFPSADLEHVVIIQAGRKPAPLIKSLGMVFGGILLAGLGIVLFFAGSRD